MLGVIFNLNSCKLLLIGALKTLWKDVNFSFLFLRKVKVRSRTSHQASVNRFSLSDPFLKRHISGTFSCNVCRPDALLFLLTADVLSEEAILKWYSDAHLSKGRSVFLEQMKKFVEWLKNAEEGKKNKPLLKIFDLQQQKMCDHDEIQPFIGVGLVSKNVLGLCVS